MSVSEQRDQQILEDIPVRLSFPQGFVFPHGVVVEPPSVNATLVGAKEQLRDVAASNLTVYAEVPADAPLLSATNALEVSLVARIPQDKSIFEVNLTPSAVRLTAEAAPSPPAPSLPSVSSVPPVPDVPEESVEP